MQAVRKGVGDFFEIVILQLFESVRLSAVLVSTVEKDVVAIVSISERKREVSAKVLLLKWGELREFLPAFPPQVTHDQ